jgi:hypothetical protein
MLEKLDTLIAFAVVMLGVSLIITILTQIISTFLGLRGSNLLWGIETLFKQLAPDLDNPKGSARTLSKQILQHELVSDSSFSQLGEMWLVGPFVKYLSERRPTSWIIERWRYATAIRLEELVRVLQGKIDKLDPNSNVRKELEKLLAAANPEAKRRLDMLNDALRAITPPPLAPVPALASPPAAFSLAASTPNYAVQVDKILQDVTDTAQQSVGKLETWFSSSMDRVAQRFVVQARIWTVVFAFLVAFGAHLDSLSLLNQLSINPDTRKALVNMRNDMLGQADTLLAPATAVAAAPGVPISPKILNEALAELKKDNPKVAIDLAISADTTSAQDVAAALTKAGVPADVVANYQQIVIGVLRRHAVTIDEGLTNAGLQLIPTPYPWFKFDGWRNMLGILLTALFLSLGAPFWYNALKNLSNLRSVVASKEQQESSAA